MLLEQNFIQYKVNIEKKNRYMTNNIKFLLVSILQTNLLLIEKLITGSYVSVLCLKQIMSWIINTFISDKVKFILIR